MRSRYITSPSDERWTVVPPSSDAFPTGVGRTSYMRRKWGAVIATPTPAGGT